MAAFRDPETILIINIRLIGDVILTTPLIDMIRKRWPTAKIDFLANRGTAEMLEKDPRLRKILYHENVREKGFKGRGVGGGFYLFRILKRYDMAISLGDSDRGTIAAAIAGKRVRLGFLLGHRGIKRWFRKLLLTHQVDFPPFHAHMIEACQRVFEVLGEEPGDPVVRVYWDDDDLRTVNERFPTLEQGRYLVVHPFARLGYKDLPEVQLVAAVTDLARDLDLAVVATSGPDQDEKRKLSELSFPEDIEVHRSPGSLTLNQVACLISRSRVYLGVDTAVSHIAASTGVPMVAFFGPSRIYRWGPWNNARPEFRYPERGRVQNGQIMVFQKDWDCVPCGLMGCNGSFISDCLLEIEATEIVKAIQDTLRGGC